MSDLARTSLPRDLWMSILGFVTEEMHSVACVCQEFASIARSEEFSRLCVEQRYPADTICRESYPSWRAMLLDGNAKNGVYVLDRNARSGWKFNGNHRYYTNAVISILVDRSIIGLVVMGLGHADLRDAGKTSVFRVEGESEEAATPDRATKLVNVAVDRVENQPGFKLCVIHFHQKDFLPHYEYRFTYNGSRTHRGSDYDCDVFLKANEVAWVRQCLRYRDQFRFVSRGGLANAIHQHWKEHNGDTFWNSVPQPIRQLHEQSSWGETITGNQNIVFPPVVVLGDPQVMLHVRRRRR
mmetsp:Transcript_33436/g.77060  ORF Transcript_33436/g.77060 Transcript_33436/m.77060 type:complete len:297 (+) Transcript_33436:129-1019(+)|eukprot:CAMPEP_0116830556 /NCGR_PEP_ID=MMETSP0418-20121206/4826_1 /TAXON_ID=1158023 /ORGANISM="Astrosyne radiata, Strain 13vi08-1A" /LENGTH=296 /DNA_ID=CAMNT_0004459667 /DNA_START=108 /DNA_END=998 /DNA_ORIENTATION=+